MAKDINPAVTLAEPQPITVDYINWRGEYGRRRIAPIRIVFGSTEWHPEPQWLLEAFDLDKKATRLFTFADMQTLRPPAPDRTAQAPDTEERS